VKVKQQLVIPNAFSPNGDGINDVWRIANANEYPALRVQLFDRYGQLVLSSTGYAQPWDGTIRGRNVPSGTYYYIITTEDGNAPIKGSVTLLR
jgi:gliding motility-associated-like protein